MNERQLNAITTALDEKVPNLSSCFKFTYKDQYVNLKTISNLGYTCPVCNVEHPKPKWDQEPYIRISNGRAWFNCRSKGSGIMLCNLPSNAPQFDLSSLINDF